MDHGPATGMDELRVIVEARARGDAARYRQAARALTGHIKKVIGESVRVDIVAPATLDRSQGKASRVRDRR